MSLSSPKVLIFESDSVFAGELKLGLEQHACSVTVVGDATEGLQLAANNRPDLVLLTVELPRVNGFSVCNKLKRDPGLKSVPLIIMSSDSNEDTFSQHRRLKHSRAEDYVHKPVSFEELLPRIRTLVELPDASAEVVHIHEAPRNDGYVEIGDELEELDAEDTELDAEFDAELEVESMPPEAPVDEEVDEFTEHAFDAMLEDNAAAAPSEDDPDTKVDATRSLFPQGATPVPPTLTRAPSMRAVSSIPPPNRRPTSVVPAARSRPVRSVSSELAGARLSESQALAALDPAILAEKDQAIGVLEGLLAEANAELEAHKAEVNKLRRDNEQVHRDLSRSRTDAPAAGAGTAQDFLSLREALNRKDKEVLELHGQVSQKSRELLTIRDVSLGYEREKADAVEKLLANERELHELNRVLVAAKADKDQAAKRADDFKRRTDKLVSDSQEKEQIIEALRAQFEALEQSNARDIVDSRVRSEEQARAAEETQARALAQAAEEAEQRMAQAVQGAVAEVEMRLSREREQERSIAERDKQAAVEHHEARLKTEHEQALAMLIEEKATQYRELEQARDATLGRARRQIEQEQANVRELREELSRVEQELAATREAFGTEQAELGHTRTTLESTRADLTHVLGDLESTRLSLGNAQSDVNTLGRELESLQHQLSSTRGELASTQGSLASAQADLGAAGVRVQRLEAELHDLHAELSAARSDLGQLQGEFNRVSATASAALQKWEQDKDALHRGREALQAALDQLSQIEGRPLN